ncbi:MAG TPA: c-type cytochrome [Burkholderiaceae bacterium]|nr:c-type cytochrome [Burkholderiaceae bacterium]
MMRIVVAFAAAALLALAAAAAAIHWGWYNVAATEPHLQPTRWLLDVAMRRSVHARIDRIVVPALDDAQMIERGLALYRRHCLSCHGAPGVAPAPFALGMRPLPANLAYTARHWRPAEIYWVVRHGVRMTGMPAWQFRMSDADLWATVAFVRRLPMLSPTEFQAQLRNAPADGATAAAAAARQDAAAAAVGDPVRGKQAIEQYGCAACHRIPGIADDGPPVGPALDRIATRGVIAGVLPNSRENMIRWLLDPQQVDPQTAMPALGIDPRDAADIAAFLYQLR